MASDRYGVGEWFGHIVATTPGPVLNQLPQKAKIGFKQANLPCPFRQSVEPDAMCNKKGGVCSLQTVHQADDGAMTAFGPFVTMCPSRFWQDTNVFRWIGQEIIGTSKPVLIKEVDFLESVVVPDAPAPEDESGTGFTRAVSADLRRKLSAIETPKSKLTKSVNKPHARWVDSTLLADVEYRDVTSDGYLRHSSFKGLAGGKKR